MGVALRNSSMYYGTIVEVKASRFVLDEQKLGRRKIPYEDICAMLDPTTGDEIATVRFIRRLAHISVPARVLIVAGVLYGILALFAVLSGGIGR